jgi:hypothetical protein
VLVQPSSSEKEEEEEEGEEDDVEKRETPIRLLLSVRPLYETLRLLEAEEWAEEQCTAARAVSLLHTPDARIIMGWRHG